MRESQASRMRSGSFFLLSVVLLTIQRTAIEREERYLEGKFGEEYLDYKARVRRWI